MLPGFEPAAFRPFAKEVTARSLPPKMFPGENRRSSPGALPARRFRVEPALVCCSRHCRCGAGIMVATKYLRLHCPENWSARRDSHPHGRGPRVSETRVYAVSPLAESWSRRLGSHQRRSVTGAFTARCRWLLGYSSRKMVRTEGLAPTGGFRPPASRAGAFADFATSAENVGQVARSRTEVLAVTTRCSVWLSYASEEKETTARRETMGSVSAFASSVATDGGKWSER